MSGGVGTTGDLSRVEAARLLRAARTASEAARSEKAGWAHVALPESLPACRLYIESLLESDDLSKADALLSQALLKHPTSPSLGLLRARSLELQEKHDEAAAELDLALGARPGHRGALESAARVAGRRGRHDDAVEYLRRAVEAHPGGRPLRVAHVEALLAAGRIAEAATAMMAFDERSALVTARLFRAQHRLLDAAELLESAAARPEGCELHDEVVAELIDVLEAIGDGVRLRGLAASLADDQPRALHRAGWGLLSLGDFQAACRAANRAARSDPHRRDALHVLVVAAALDERLGLARRALRRLGACRAGVDRALMAECWRTGLQGRLLRDQSSPGTSGADPAASLLRPLLERARDVFEHALAESPTASEQHDLERHRAVCLALLEPRSGPSAVGSRVSAPERRCDPLAESR